MSVALILGSGLGALADAVEPQTQISYEQIPGHPISTVPGHAGRLVLGTLAGLGVAVWSGRVHFYEGRPMYEVAYPARLAATLGAKVLIVTNAAGGLSETARPGQIMIVRDHINLPGLAGHSPLFGGNAQNSGTRFVSLSDAYDASLRLLAHSVGAEMGIDLREGVYAMVAGPNYETPAEARLLRFMGADAVGMSTVPEVIAAREAGLRVLALSVITNQVALEYGAGAQHAEVLDVSQAVRPILLELIRGILRALSASGER